MTGVTVIEADTIEIANAPAKASQHLDPDGVIVVAEGMDMPMRPSKKRSELRKRTFTQNAVNGQKEPRQGHAFHMIQHLPAVMALAEAPWVRSWIIGTEGQ
jgi:hypothetical protein